MGQRSPGMPAQDLAASLLCTTSHYEAHIQVPVSKRSGFKVQTSRMDVPVAVYLRLMEWARKGRYYLVVILVHHFGHPAGWAKWYSGSAQHYYRLAGCCQPYADRAVQWRTLQTLIWFSEGPHYCRVITLLHAGDVNPDVSGRPFEQQCQFVTKRNLQATCARML
jgi:hypothetical protein